MYVEVARYKLGRGSADELVPKIREGNVPVMREVSGFVEYYALQLANDEVASIAVFRDRSSAEEANQQLATWIEETVSEFDVTPVDLIEGDVIVTTRE
jgi:hypothetical protein